MGKGVEDSGKNPGERPQEGSSCVPSYPGLAAACLKFETAATRLSAIVAQSNDEVSEEASENAKACMRAYLEMLEIKIEYNKENEVPCRIPDLGLLLPPNKRVVRTKYRDLDTLFEEWFNMVICRRVGVLQAFVRILEHFRPDKSDIFSNPEDLIPMMDTVAEYVDELYNCNDFLDEGALAALADETVAQNGSPDKNAISGFLKTYWIMKFEGQEVLWKIALGLWREGYYSRVEALSVFADYATELKASEFQQYVPSLMINPGYPRLMLIIKDYFPDQSIECVTDFLKEFEGQRELSDENIDGIEKQLEEYQSIFDNDFEKLKRFLRKILNPSRKTRFLDDPEIKDFAKKSPETFEKIYEGTDSLRCAKALAKAEEVYGSDMDLLDKFIATGKQGHHFGVIHLHDAASIYGIPLSKPEVFEICHELSMDEYGVKCYLFKRLYKAFENPDARLVELREMAQNAYFDEEYEDERYYLCFLLGAYSQVYADNPEKFEKAKEHIAIFKRASSQNDEIMYEQFGGLFQERDKVGDSLEILEDLMEGFLKNRHTFAIKGHVWAEGSQEAYGALCKFVRFGSEYHLGRFRKYTEGLDEKGVEEARERMVKVASTPELMEEYKKAPFPFQGIAAMRCGNFDERIAEMCDRKALADFIGEAALLEVGIDKEATFLDFLSSRKDLFLSDGRQIFKNFWERDSRTYARSLKVHFSAILKSEGLDSQNLIRLFELYDEFLGEFSSRTSEIAWHMFLVLSDEGAKSYLGDEKYAKYKKECEAEGIYNVEDLKTKLCRIKSNLLLNPTRAAETLRFDGEKTNSPLAMSALNELVGYLSCNFRTMGRDLEDIVCDYLRAQKDIGELDIIESDITIRCELRAPETDPAINENIGTVQNSIKKICDEEKKLKTEEEALEILKEEFVNDLARDIERIKTSMEEKDEHNERKIRQLTRLESTRAAAEASTTMLAFLKTVLASDPKKYETTIRDIMYYFAAADPNFNLKEGFVFQDVEMIKIELLGEFVLGHLLGETLKKLAKGLDKNERKLVKRAFSSLGNFIKQKNDEKRAFKEKSEQVSKENKSLGILSGRTLLTELSAYYTDSCWAQVSNLTKNNPNSQSQTFVENIDDPLNVEIVGGALTFVCSTRVRTPKGGIANRKVLLVRGLNPSLDYLDTSNAEDIVEGYLDDIMVDAMDQGCKYIAVPLYILAALSNRYEVFSHLWDKYQDCPRISLNEDFDFNGHKVKDACVVVRVDGIADELIPSKIPVDQIPINNIFVLMDEV